MSKKTHDKELARARAKRQAERAAQQRTRRVVAAGVIVVVAGAAVALGFALQGDDGAPDPAATARSTEAPTAPATGAATDPATDPAPEATTAEPFAVAPPPMVIDPNAEYTATIETDLGPITVDLAAEQAPTTVNNFVALAASGFYDGVVFHRIQEDFVIQGGDPEGTGRGGPGYEFDDELAHAEQVVEDNEGVYPRGTVAMANAGPNTNGSQFFIVDAEDGYPFPPNYAIFGMVSEGLDVVDAIAAGEVTGPQQDQAADPVAMTTVTIDGPVEQETLAGWTTGG